MDPIAATGASGVRVLGLRQPHLHRIVLSAMLRVGSRYEDRRTNGLSHFLEHMLFRGTPTHPTSHELADAFESLGGTLVAATSSDTGTLGVATPVESFDASLRLLAEVYTRPVFSNLEIEKGIVHEELLETLGDDGVQVEPEDLVRQLCFDGHPLAMPIIGTTESLESFHHQQLVDHHGAHYTSRNSVVVLAGPIDDTHVRRVADAFSSVPDAVLPSSPPPGPHAGPRFRFVRNSSSQTQLCVGFRAPALISDEEPAMDLLMRALDDGMSTRLYGEICDRRGLCYDVSADYEGYADSGIVEIHAECVHSNAPKVLETILEIVRSLRDEGPTEREVRKAQQRHAWESQRMLDAGHDLVEHFALSELSGCDPDLERRVEAIAALGVDDVRGVAGRWWRRENLSVVAVGLQPKRATARLEKMTRDFE